MDIVLLVGLIGVVGMIVGLMISGGGIGLFIDVFLFLIVGGGIFFVVMYIVLMGMFFGSFGVMVKVFMFLVYKNDELIEKMVELFNMVCKDGMMVFEG